MNGMLINGFEFLRAQNKKFYELLAGNFLQTV